MGQPQTSTLIRPSISEQLGAFVAELPADAIPEEVLAHARICLLDTLGCGLFGSQLPQSSIVREALLSAGAAAGGAILWGSGATLTAPDAALVNGTSVHAFELDDLHPRSIVHPGSVIATAALAAASLSPQTTGRELLVAIVLGYEVAARVGNSMGAAHLLAGWHPTGTHGTLGAAAAAGRILELDAGELANALGTAGTQSAGLMSSQFESMVKRFHAGRAAQSGVYAALLARGGYIGIRELFEADYGGYLSTFSPRSDAAALTADLGTVWETMNVGFKPYSTNGSCHPAIDLLRELFHAEGVRREAVESVEFFVSTATVKHVGWPYRPSTVTTAQMNLPFITAVVLSDGDAFVEQFTEQRIHDPELVDFTARVHVIADPDIDAAGDGARHRTRLRLTLRGGRVFEAERNHAHGSARDPMTEVEVREKYRRLAATVLPDAQLRALETEVDRLDERSSLEPLTRLLGPAQAGRAYETEAAPAVRGDDEEAPGDHTFSQSA